MMPHCQLKVPTQSKGAMSEKRKGLRVARELQAAVQHGVAVAAQPGSLQAMRTMTGSDYKVRDANPSHAAR